MHKRNKEMDANLLRPYLRPGRRNARTSEELAHLTGLADATIRATVSYMILDKGEAVASMSSSPAGYFIPVTSSERAAAASHLISRGKAILARAYKLMGLPMEKVVSQMDLDLSPESGGCR